MHAEGQGVMRSDREAVNWYRKAAMQGQVEAETSLGLMYRQGRGVEQSDKEAFRWFEKAAHKGEPAAQFNLADYYLNGKGVLADPVKCYAWVMLAAEQGNSDAASALPQVKGLLNPSQQSMAEVEARKYRAGYAR